MSLKTPDKIRILQRKLYCKAKKEPGYRFYLLYDKIHREDILAHAYALAKSNQGASGVITRPLSRSSRKGWRDGWPASGKNCAKRSTSRSRCDG